jgi:hypothetical protein
VRRIIINPSVNKAIPREREKYSSRAVSVSFMWGVELMRTNALVLGLQERGE